MYILILENRITGCHGNHAFLILLQDLKLTKHWFSSFQDVVLAEGMNVICATLRPPMTIFLMAGASTSRGSR